MKQKKTKINFFGELGETIGKEWNLVVDSFGEAMRAIEVLSGHRLYKFLLQKDEEGVRYKVFINEKQFIPDKELSPDDLESIRNSELSIKRPIESISVVPVLEGSDGGNSGILGIILGVVLIVVGIFVPVIGVALIIGGIGLVAAGIINLLTSPPKFEDFREIEGGGRPSYLFSGPQNTTREGGPVPVGYGRLIVGSQVISASYEVTHKDASNQPLTS